jgi:hypothetical protein
MDFTLGIKTESVFAAGKMGLVMYKSFRKVCFTGKRGLGMDGVASVAIYFVALRCRCSSCAHQYQAIPAILLGNGLSVTKVITLKLSSDICHFLAYPFFFIGNVSALSVNPSSIFFFPTGCAVQTGLGMVNP